MITTKQDFVRTFLPETVTDITFTQMDLDITDLSLADVMRNVNKIYPLNTRARNSIASGKFAVGVLCKTETLYPLSGLLLIVTGHDINIEIVSRNYIVISVSEDMITSDENIKQILDGITRYIVITFRGTLLKLKEFYAKFVYDPYEMAEDISEEAEEELNAILQKYKRFPNPNR